MRDDFIKKRLLQPIKAWNKGEINTFYFQKETLHNEN